MQGQAIQKIMYSTNRKQKLFNVRKMPNKNPDPQKLLLTPQQLKTKKQECFRPPNSISVINKQNQYNLQESILCSSLYQQLNRKYNRIKNEQIEQKDKLMQSLKQKQVQLDKYNEEKLRLNKEKQKLIQKLKSLKQHYQLIRQRNYCLRYQQQQRIQHSNIINFQYLRNVLISLRYQNELFGVDPDNMTYEQLLQLQQRMGSVNRGLTTEQLQKLQKLQYEGKQDEICSICYYEMKKKELINRFECGHIFHCDCIKEWLEKEKKCPICKKQIIIQ